MHNQQDMDPQATGCAIQYIYGVLALLIFMTVAFLGITVADAQGWL